jgi:hypothetical protein
MMIAFAYNLAVIIDDNTTNHRVRAGVAFCHLRKL